MSVIDGGRRLETHCGVRTFRIIFGIQVKSVFLAVRSLLNIDIIYLLMMKQVVCLKLLLFCKRLLLISLEGRSLQIVI